MQTDTERQVYAGFFVRLAAFLVDMLIVNVGLVTVKLPMWIVSLQHPDNILVRDFIFKYSIVDIVLYILTALYFVLLTYYTGSTLGKKLFQLRVVSTENRKLTLFEVAYRETIGRFLSAVVMQLGYLLVIIQKEHRGVHDLLSDTCVIYYHEKKVYVHAQMNYRNMAPNPGYMVPPGGPGNMPPNGPGGMPANGPGNTPFSGAGNVPAAGPGNTPYSRPGAMSSAGSGNVPPGYFAGPSKEETDGSGSVTPSVSEEKADGNTPSPKPSHAESGPETPDVPFERNE